MNRGGEPAKIALGLLKLTVLSPEMLCTNLTANMSHQQWRDWVSPDIDYTTLCPNLPTP